MTDTPTPPPSDGWTARGHWNGPGWTVDVDDSTQWSRQPAQKSFAARIAWYLAALVDAGTQAAAWARPRLQAFERAVRHQLDHRAEIAGRCGLHYADIGTRHGNEPLHRAAVAAAHPIRASRRILAAAALLVGLLAVPTIASWRPYVQLQRAADRRIPAWAQPGGHPHTTGQHVVHWLATSPGLAIAIALFAAVWTAQRIAVITHYAARGYAAPTSRILLAGAAIGLTALVRHPATEAAAHVAGAHTAPIAPVALALVLGLALTAFNNLTARQAAVVRRLNRHTARFDIVAEQREAAAAQPPLGGPEFFTGSTR